VRASIPRRPIADPKAARAAAVLFLVLAAACRRTPPPSPDAVARIGGAGGVEIRYPQFRAYVAEAVGESEGLLASAVLSELFDQFLDERLLARLASDRGLDGGSEAPGRQGIDALLEREVEAPKPAEIAAYYRAHAAEFARPERVHLRQILVDTRSEAERAESEIAGGLDFAAVARRRSRDPSAERGGDQGELAASDLPAAFSEVIFALKPGQASGIVPADYGFHIFEVVERLPAETVPLERAAGDISRRLRRERADRRLRELVKEARGRYNVEIYAHNLPFEYQGAYRAPKAARP